MKSHRFRFFRFRRTRRTVRGRGTSFLFKRFSSFEGLELRALLSGTSLLGDSALVSTTDPYASPLEEYSLANLLESAPDAAPLAANATENYGAGDVIVDPLVDEFVATATVQFTDLEGNEITEVTAGQDFLVKVFVTDTRTSTDLDGVASASVRLSFNTGLLSLLEPSSVVVADNFQDLLPYVDTSAAGQIDAGGTWVETNPANLPDPGEPQLLWTAKLRATASGTANFTTAFVGGDAPELFLFGEETPRDPADFDFQPASLTINALPTLSVGDVSQAEGDTNSSFVFTVTLSEASASDVSVLYNTSNGTATAGSDYTAASGTVVFEPGATTKLVTITVIGDTASEVDETFNVVLSNPTGATIDDGTGVGTILDDDAPLLSVGDKSQLEQDGVNTMVFTVTLSKAATGEVTVQYNTADGTATVGDNDYNAASGTLTFNASTLTQTVTVTINGDTVDEDNETFQLVLSNPTGAELSGNGIATGTIQNDDGPVLALDPATVTVTEDDSDTTMVFTVTLTEANDEMVTVVYNTVDGTATAGSDYAAASGTLTFAAGETGSQTITVTILGDNLIEDDETFSVVLSSPSNASIAVNSAVGTIENDDLPAITLEGPTSVNEGNGTYVVTARLAAASTEAVTVVWATANGTATSDTDYTAASGTLTFAAGQTTQLITVSLLNDDVVEPNETFTINLSSPVNAELGQTQFTATIANDDDVPTVEVTPPASQNEGNVGDTPFVFTVTLNKAGTETITVAYATTDAIAQAGSDYTATSGTLTFAAGETSKTVTVMVTGDTLFENANETFRLVLSNPTNATLKSGGSSATAVIVNDDSQPTVSISDAVGTEGDTGSKQFVFTVSLTNPSTTSATVRWTTQDGTATAGSDYTAASGTLTFAAGETSKTVTVNVLGDLNVEGNETFSVVLSNPSNAVLGDTTGIGTIQDESTDNVNIIPSTILGKVYIDANSDNAQGTYEKSLAGITVNLTGAATKSTTTAADGSYSFGNLNPGTYTVKFVLPSQYRDGEADLGTGVGGSLVEDGFTFTIAEPGGVTGTGYNFTTRGLLPQFFSHRLFLSSYLAELSEGSVQVGVSVNTVTNPINAANANSTSISGTGTVGATISVVATDGTNSTAAQTTTVAANGTWSINGINVLTLADGTITYNVTASASGTTDTDSITTSKDTVAPSVAATTVTNPIRSTNATDTAISGTGTTGAIITVVVTDGTNSTSAATTTVGSGGTWSLGGINVSALANGTLTYNVTATDAAGNTANTSITSTKDTQAPAVAITGVTDPINADNEDEVTISGTGEEGDTITLNITDGTNTVGPLSTTVAANGTWSIASINLTSLNDGTITFTVVATDGVGNTTQTTETATKDTATQVAVTSVTDPINAENDNAVSISGTGEEGATINVVISDGTNSINAGPATVAAGGTWTIPVIDVSTLADDAELTFTVTATDIAGNTAQAVETALKDTVAPDLEIDDVTDPINMNNEDATEISGTGEVGAGISVVVTDGTNSTTAATTTVDNDGNWSISGINVTSLNDGTLTYTVVATDAAGNTTTETITAEKSTLAVSDVTDPITQANQTQVVISGTGQANATVTVVATDGVNDVTPDAVTIDENGDWSVTLDVTSLADGVITFNVTAQAGDDSVQTSITADKDTVADGTIEEVADPVFLGNVTGVFAAGTSELDATVSVVVTDGVNSTTPVEATADAGVWIASGIDVSSLTDGQVTYEVTITDSLGNVTVYTMTALKDTVAPDLEVDSVTDPIGISNADDVTISGTGEEGDTISVVVTDGTTSTTAYTTTVDGDGNWTIEDIDVSGLADGELTFNVTATDTAGNESTDSITADKVTVAVEEVTDPITQANVETVTISGTGQIGAEVTVVATDGVSNVTSDTVTIDGTGQWSVTIDVSTLADGTITFDVTAEDGGKSVQRTATAEKDTLAEGGILSVTDPVNAANADSASASGTSEAGATVFIAATDGDTTITAVEVTPVDGAWSIDNLDISSLADGEITYQVTITDALGNVTVYTLTANKDTVAPGLEVDDVTDPIGISSAHSAAINGTGEVGATITVIVTDGVNSTDAFTTTVDGDGNWSIEGMDVSGLADGELTFTVTATDAAGNETAGSIVADKITVAIDGVTDPISQTNEETVTISGTGQIGAEVTVVASDGVNTVTPDSVTIDGNGDWSVTLDVSSLADGTITFEVTADDGSDSVVKSITADKDTVADGEILTLTDPINADNQDDVALSGATEGDSEAELTITDGVTTIGPISIAVGEDGNWSVGGLDLTSLADGTITFTVEITDSKGNVSQYSEVAAKDTVAPILNEPLTPPLNAENVPDYSIGGTSEAGATIMVSFTDGVTTIGPAQTTVDGGGFWAIEGLDLSALSDGEITITLVASDAAGNETMLVIQRTKDTAAPAVDLTTVDPEVINADADETVTISGTGEVGATVSVAATDGNSTVEPAPVTVDGDGNWSIVLDVSSLADGNIEFTATATDDLGNTSSDSQTVVKDTFTTIEANLSGGQVSSANAASVLLFGKRESGATIEVTISDGVTTLNGPAAQGSGIGWSMPNFDVSSLQDGTLTVIATATDAAGNTATVQFEVQKDTTVQVAVGDLTDPIGLANETSVSISGTGDVGASISVVASDGVNSTIAFAVVVDEFGDWSITDIDVSDLNDGTITFTVTAEDDFGNSTQVQATADKDTSAEPLTLLAEDDSEDGDVFSESEDWLSFD